MNSKRGLSHIEAVLSFVIFVGFLIFAFLFFSPFGEGNRLLDSSIDYAFREIIDNSSVTVESYSVVIDESVGDDEVAIEVDTKVSGGVLVEDRNGDVLASRFNGAEVHFNRGGGYFVVARLGEDFDNGEVIGSLLAEGLYRVSSSEREDILSEKRVLDLNNIYYDDYNALKTYFNLPNRVDFGFALALQGNTIVGERPIPENLEVVSVRERLKVIREGTGEIEFGDLIISVW